MTGRRSNRSQSFCRVIERVDITPEGFWRFEGPIYQPGSMFTSRTSGSGEGRVVLECAGPVSKGKGHNRPEYLWILWRWNDGWHELARALSTDWDWSIVLGPAAHQALQQNAPLSDAKARSLDFASEILEYAERRLRDEPAGLQRQVWMILQDRIAPKMMG